jgi:hypothetical protein
MFRKTVLSTVPLGLAAAAAIAAPVAHADAQPYYVMSSQQLCDVIWPFSQAAPDPAKFGTVCVRSGGMLERLSKAMPAFISDKVVLEPGSAAALPAGSARVDPANPMSDWMIPG